MTVETTRKMHITIMEEKQPLLSSPDKDTLISQTKSHRHAYSSVFTQDASLCIYLPLISILSLVVLYIYTNLFMRCASILANSPASALELWVPTGIAIVSVLVIAQTIGLFVYTSFTILSERKEEEGARLERECL